MGDVFNLLPNSNVEELVKAFAVKTNDMMLAVYLSSIIRSVLALHNLINNKLYNKEKQLKPVMVIIDVKPKQLGIPTEAYFAVEEVIEGQQLQWTFKHFPSEIGATEAEEVGVEHLLRDVKDMTISTLSNQITQKLSSLRGQGEREGRRQGGGR